MSTKSYLFAFDFDHTVVDDNSDTFIFKLLDGGVPKDIRDIYDNKNWTEYMNKVFEHMHEKGITIEDICACVKSMEPTKGMLELLTTLVQLKTSSSVNIPEGACPAKVDILVISDANNLFISEYLNARVLDPLAQNKNDLQLPNVFDVITNWSSVASANNNNKSQPLVITPYALQTTCQICPKNLCKGSALQRYIEGKGPYTRVFYTGDGGNDHCPALKLNQYDFLFPRINFRLWKKITASPDKLGINAEIVNWDDAETIREVIQEQLSL